MRGLERYRAAYRDNPCLSHIKLVPLQGKENTGLDTNALWCVKFYQFVAYQLDPDIFQIRIASGRRQHPNTKSYFAGHITVVTSLLHTTSSTTCCMQWQYPRLAR